ncbi:hypothetical protein NHX12_014992, partial [Muraenolepis orangiensis]
MEQVSDDELDHPVEEDSDTEDQDLDKMFGAWLGELDKLTQSLDDGKPQKVIQKPPLREETNMANFSYRFSMYNINDSVDLDALMADLCSIEQELSTISKPNSTSRASAKGSQRGPGGSHSASAKHTGGGGSSGGSASSSTRASPANTLEKASLSMDEAARGGSGGGGGQHRRTGSVGTVCEQEAAAAAAQRSGVNSPCASASSMDSLDMDKVLRGAEPAEASKTQNAPGQGSTEHASQRRANGKPARRQLDFKSCDGELDRAT